MLQVEQPASCRDREPSGGRQEHRPPFPPSLHSVRLGQLTSRRLFTPEHEPAPADALRLHEGHPTPGPTYSSASHSCPSFHQSAVPLGSLPRPGSHTLGEFLLCGLCPLFPLWLHQLGADGPLVLRVVLWRPVSVSLCLSGPCSHYPTPNLSEVGRLP